MPRRSRLIYRAHALQRLQERDVSDEPVRMVLAEGEEIETYPADRPYPSRLVLGWYGPRPIHVVAAENSIDNETLIITVYEPDSIQWEPGFERRRS